MQDEEASNESALTKGGGQGSGDGDGVEPSSVASELDHYVVLGVGRDASEKAIVQAYRMASLKYHPDRSGGSTAAFQRVHLAYETLADEQRRRAYDSGESQHGGAAGDHGTSAEGAHAQQERWRRFYHPFGDPFVHRRKLAAERQKREAEAAARARRKASRAKEKE